VALSDETCGRFGSVANKATFACATSLAKRDSDGTAWCSRHAACRHIR